MKKMPLGLPSPSILIDDNDGDWNACPKDDISRQPDNTFSLCLRQSLLTHQSICT